MVAVSEEPRGSRPREAVRSKLRGPLEPEPALQASLPEMLKSSGLTGAAPPELPVKESPAVL